MHIGIKDVIFSSDTLNMTHTLEHQKRILTTFVFLLCLYTIGNTQTVAEVISDSDNSVVFRIENINTEKSPTKILLVYDSNLITLETEGVSSRLYQQKTSYVASGRSNSSAASALALTLAVEFERDIEVEEWMLQPFDTQLAANNYTRTDVEPEIKLESWMYDLSTW